MRPLKFEWDNRKGEANKNKHGVSFEEAQTVFFDPHAKVIFDDEHSLDEERFVILGLSRKTRLLIVCHCYRADGDTIRIISARKATTGETRQYRDAD
ncbi:hypothetical protein AGMMS49959_01370 [Planctomycetales bacterium]|nr:hypothetical protein AGMMS49959_01370 [Planctomycetales bacterium]